MEDPSLIHSYETHEEIAYIALNPGQTLVSADFVFAPVWGNEKDED